MKYSPKQITLDHAEYLEMQSMIADLSKLPEDGSLTTIELQEAIGLLLVRALQNPGLFRAQLTEIELGKFKAIFAIIPRSSSGLAEDSIRIKLVRT